MALTLLGVPLAQAQGGCAGALTAQVCRVAVTDESGPITGAAGQFLLVENFGQIDGDPAVAMGQSYGLIVVNGENAVINGDIVRSVANNSFFNFTVNNSGTINGNVIVNEQLAPNVFTNPNIRYIADGGTVTGDVQLGTVGFGTAMFLQRGDDDGVDGTISAGLGIDIYAKRYESSRNLTLGEYDLPDSFEVEGYAPVGADTVLTLNGTSTTISLMGDGQVVNKATIDPIDPIAHFPANVIVTPPAIGYQYVDIAVYLRPGMTANTNASFYTIGFNGALTSFTNEGVLNADVRLAAKNFINSGAINLKTAAASSVVHAGADSDFTFLNSGIISMVHNGDRLATTTPESEFDSGLDAALRLRSAINSTQAHDVGITNSGTIIGGLDIWMIAENFSLTNSGTLSGLVEGEFEVPSLRAEIGELYLTLPTATQNEFNGATATFLNSASGNITHGAALDFAAFDVSFTNEGTITGVAAFDHVAWKVEQDMLQADDEDNFDGDRFTLNNGGTVDGTIFVEAEASVASFVNSGNVVRPVRDATSSVQFYGAEYAAFDVLSETVGNQILSFTNSGLIETRDRASSGLVLEIEAGEDGSDGPATIASAEVTITNSGIIKASGGATRYILSPAPNVVPLLNLNAALAVDASDVTGASTVILRNQAAGLIEVSGQLSQVTADGYFPQGVDAEQFGSVAVIAQGRVIQIENDGIIRGGAGSSFNPLAQFEPDILRSPYLAGAIHTLGVEDEAGNYTGSLDHLINSASGKIFGSIDLGAGNDKLDNYGEIDGNIFMGDGDDTLTHSLLAKYTGIADGGAGNDTLLFDITGTLNFAAVDEALSAQFISFEVRRIIGTANIVEGEPIVIGPGSTILDEGLTFTAEEGQSALVLADTSGPVVVNSTVSGNIELQGQSNNLNIGTSSTITGDIVGGNGSYSLGNSGEINGSVLLGDGGNSLVNSGNITDDVIFGTGNDNLTLTGDWAIGGEVVGGAGIDAVTVSFSSAPVSEADVPVIDMSNFVGFETLTVDGGVGKVSDASFDNIAITNGRLIGASGGTIQGDVTIGAGGTFGSAGTVIGDVTVQSGGTFSPGASPEVHEGVGDFEALSGSITLFEFVPAPGQSDQILQDGTFHIEAGALLEIRGERPLTPGIIYDMIVADELTGAEFTILAWDRSAVQGFLRYTPTSLQLVGTFALAAPSTPQVITSLDYVNLLLIGDEASDELIAAIPSLLNEDGFASVSAFSNLTPEAYASAAQLGVDHGLSIISASRSQRAFKGGSEGGLFSYAQFIGDWSKLKAGRHGASRVKANHYGVMGGLGYGNEAASLSAFIGYLDSKQRIDALDAKTKADGLFVGVQAQYHSENFAISAMLAHDWSNATSERSLLDDKITGEYDLNSFVMDAHMAVKLPLSDDWTIGPRAGLSHISTKRGAVTEVGSDAFALELASKRYKASFADAALRLEGGMSADASVQPWLEAGLRHQLSGRTPFATAGFIGSPATLTVAGAQRKETLWTAAAGLKASLSQAAELYGSYHGEFGGGGHNRINVGIRYRF
jgi:hypothetical protein